MTRPTNLPNHTRRHLDNLIAGCPEMTTLAAWVREFAAILTQRRGQDLAAWIAQTRRDALPGFDSYLNGLGKDQDATVAGLTLPYSNGPTEGMNTKAKMLKRQTHGRASIADHPVVRVRTCVTPGKAAGRDVPFDPVAVVRAAHRSPPPDLTL